MPEERRRHVDRLKAQLLSAAGRSSKAIKDREAIEAVIDVPEAGRLVLSVDAGGAYSLRGYHEKSDETSAEDVLAFGVMRDERKAEERTRAMLILFVEYHSVFREFATYVFDREADLRVVAQGGSVAEGREKMAEGGIDTAIVDIPLPDEGAEELVRELHEANPSIPVLVMTHLKDPEVRPRFLEAGASEVIPKSTTLEELLAAVRKLGGEA